MTYIFTYNNMFSSNGNMFITEPKISNITDCILWLEPSKKNIILDNDKVSGWKDISGKLNNTIQIIL